MADIKPNLLTVASTRNAVEQRQMTAASLAEAFYEKISTDDKDIHAYLTLSRERAMAQAARIDALADKGDPLTLLLQFPDKFTLLLRTDFSHNARCGNSRRSATS